MFNTKSSQIASSQDNELELVRMLTPMQVADILQVNKNTVYELIERGEIVAIRLGKAYRIPRSALSFAYRGLESDLVERENVDLKNLDKVTQEIKAVRKVLSAKNVKS